MTAWHPLADSDEEQEYRRPGFRDRFLVVHPVDCFVMSFPTFKEAAEYAPQWEAKSGYPRGDVEIFDRFARRGRVDTWRIVYDDLVVTFKPIHVKPF